MLFVFLLYLPLSAAIFHCQLYFHPQSCCMWIWDAFMLVFNAFKIRPHPPPEELQQTWSQFVLKRLWSVSTSHLSFCVVSTGNYSKEECCGMICMVSDVFNCLFFCGFTWKQRKKKTSAAHCVLCCHPFWLCVGTCWFSLVLMNKHRGPDFLAWLLYEINECKFKNKQLKTHIFTSRSVIPQQWALSWEGSVGRATPGQKKGRQQQK